jgi:glycolate oxidase iron-sulfur subunit
MRGIVGQTLPYPGRFRLAIRLGQVAWRLGLPVPRAWRPMMEMIPGSLPSAGPTGPASYPAQGRRRARVALLAGGAQQVLAPDIQAATVEVLTRNGVEVLVPAGQGCCGGLSWHTGDLAAAREFAQRNLDAFPFDVDAVITNAAGCGSAMQEYPMILKGTPDEARADTLARKVRDVSAFLSDLGWEAPLRETRVRIAYQDACHLANAQGVRQPPRDLLRAIPGVELVELADADLCCGSAGSYNLDQPEIAASLGVRKAQAVMASGASVVVSGNIGCLTQMQLHLRRMGARVTVRHTMQVLRDSLGPEARP